MSPPPLSLPFPSLMLSREGQWNVVLGNNLMLVWLLAFTIEASLLCLSAVPSWKAGVSLCGMKIAPQFSCIQPLLKVPCSTLQMPPAFTVFLSSIPAFSPSNSPQCPCTFSRHTPQARLEGAPMCVYTFMRAQVHVSREQWRTWRGKGETKWDVRGEKRRRQKCNEEQVEGLWFILRGFEHEINLCLRRSVAQWSATVCHR